MKKDLGYYKSQNKFIPLYGLSGNTKEMIDPNSVIKTEQGLWSWTVFGAGMDIDKILLGKYGEEIQYEDLHKVITHNESIVTNALSKKNKGFEIMTVSCVENYCYRYRKVPEGYEHPNKVRFKYIQAI